MKGWSPAAYLRFLAWVVGAVLLLLAVGYALAKRGGWSFEAIVAAVLSCGLATAISGVLLAVPGGSPQSALNRFLVAMGARLLLVAGLCVWCLLALDVSRTPFLFALVIAYLVLLAVDTAYSVRVLRSL